jgi:hypothetical protein
MRMLVCYLDCHEAGLCCYLVIHKEILLRPLQLFYFPLTFKTITVGALAAQTSSPESMCKYYCIFSSKAKVRLSQLVLRPVNCPLYQPSIMYERNGAFGGIQIGRSNRSTDRKNFRSVNLSTINYTLTDLECNPAHRDGKPATNRLSYEAAGVGWFVG